VEAYLPEGSKATLQPGTEAPSGKSVMLAELPRLLGRSFLIGFALPATLFLLVVKVIDHSFQIDLLNLPKDADVLGIVVIPFAIMFIAILLLAINTPIVRALEGYSIPKRFDILSARQNKKFKEGVEPLLAEKGRLDDVRKSDSNAQSRLTNFSEVLPWAVSSYPDQAAFVLPTKFGNAMRAFEVYARVVYGIEAIQVWNRLTLLLPSEVMDRVKDGRSMLDFLVNMLFLSTCTIAIYVVLFIWKRHAAAWIIPTSSLITICLASAYLPTAAMQWGEMVKSVFDLHRGLLAESLGLTLPKDPSEEVNMWREVSRMMVFRSREAFLAVAKYRKSDNEREDAAESLTRSHRGRGRKARTTDRKEPIGVA
jgi:hypothetical protein